MCPEDNPIAWRTGDGTVLCIQCIVDDLVAYINPCPVYRVNIGSYSQQCHRCGLLIVDGIKNSRGEPLNLFDKPNPSPF